MKPEIVTLNSPFYRLQRSSPCSLYIGHTTLLIHTHIYFKSVPQFPYYILTPKTKYPHAKYHCTQDLLFKILIAQTIFIPLVIFLLHFALSFPSLSNIHLKYLNSDKSIAYQTKWLNIADSPHPPMSICFYLFTLKSLPFKCSVKSLY